ncbi:MAG TPA: hypothetical protein VIY73_10050, partial [Polyangiaceae bacterium]
MGRTSAVSRTSAVVSSFFAVALALNVGSTSGCGGSHGGSLFGGDGGASSGGGSSGGTSSGGLFGGSSSGTGSSSGGSSSGGQPVTCPSGAQCNVSCSGGGTTSISGKIYDPAMKDPLYNIAIYVPGGPLPTLPKGVPTGSDACNCGALFSSGAVSSTASGVDGTFKLTNAPVGKAIPLVAQVGKWRKVITVDTTQCADTAVPDKSFALPGTLTGAGQYDDMPDIAVSTGSADTLECLMLRMGVPTSEYVAGAGGTGHIHVFSGGKTGGGGGGGGGSRVGTAENPSMSGAPVSSTSLRDSQDHLMPYDILLLSC